MSIVAAKIAVVGVEPTPRAVTVLVKYEEKPGERHSFQAVSELTVGRDSGCSLPLEDVTVSRRHAVLCFEADHVIVKDVSTNGTFVGQSGFVQNASQRVPYGERIRLGRTELHVLLRGVSAVAPRTAATVLPAEAPAQTPVKPDVDGVRREVHRQLLEHLDMNAIDTGSADDPSLRPRVLAALRLIVDGMNDRMPKGLSAATLVGQMADEALGLGPLEGLLTDPSVSEIMVIDAHNIYVERGGKMSLTDCRFTDEERVRAVIERIVTPLGRRIDESSPLVDARLANGSRVNVAIRPIALRGSCITIRKFASKPFSLQDLCERGALSEAMARFLTRSVQAKKNIVIAGGTGSGKTTLLNVLSAAIPPDERILTIEDAAELQLGQPHVVSLESRPPNMEGNGEISIRALVKNALRMRPDRIVVGECRAGEALDMLQAMNTGHDGSLTTTHANSPAEALSRLETLALMAGVGLPQIAIREQISKSVHLLVQQSRLSDGSRRVTAITEIAGLDERGRFLLRPIFEYVRRGTGSDGQATGEFVATGYLPSYLPELIVKGLIAENENFL
jgi:pilus assembly protein CpaF